MRNVLFKSLRTATEGRFFIGKNRVMAVALGLDEASECVVGISQLARTLRGDLGLFFTDLAPEEVRSLFLRHEAQDYARTGSIADMTVVIEADEKGLRNIDSNELLSATVEPQLRQAGMPTRLRGGAVLLDTPQYTICREGDRLTAEQSRLLKTFGVKMALFNISLVAHFFKGSLGQYQPQAEQKMQSGLLMGSAA